MNNREVWEAEAHNWVRWARTPGHDAYWYYRDAFFDAIVPPPGWLTIEVGCGEGRVSRDLAARGHRVIAVEGSETLLRHAVRADPDGQYLLADAHALPIRDGEADLAVAYNSLMDFDDMPAAVAEAGRVLEADGAFCICIPHPLLDAGRFAGDEADAPYVLQEYYFGTRPFEETVTRSGHTMRFRGWSHCLEQYFSALAAAGFVVDALRRHKVSSASGSAASGGVAGCALRRWRSCHKNTKLS